MMVSRSLLLILVNLVALALAHQEGAESASFHEHASHRHHLTARSLAEPGHLTRARPIGQNVAAPGHLTRAKPLTQRSLAEPGHLTRARPIGQSVAAPGHLTRAKPLTQRSLAEPGHLTRSKRLSRRSVLNSATLKHLVHRKNAKVAKAHAQAGDAHTESQGVEAVARELNHAVMHRLRRKQEAKAKAAAAAAAAAANNAAPAEGVQTRDLNHAVIHRLRAKQHLKAKAAAAAAAANNAAPAEGVQTRDLNNAVIHRLRTKQKAKAAAASAPAEGQVQGRSIHAATLKNLFHRKHRNVNHRVASDAHTTTAESEAPEVAERAFNGAVIRMKRLHAHKKAAAASASSSSTTTPPAEN